MRLNEYQEAALQTAIYPDKGNNIVYPALGLNGEAGEVADHVKKIMRDDGGEITPDRRRALVKEAGDTLWYLANLAAELGYSLEDIAQENITKLRGRQERGTLQGSGDER